MNFLYHLWMFERILSPLLETLCLHSGLSKTQLETTQGDSEKGRLSFLGSETETIMRYVRGRVAQR